jgi:hypothetical protein
MQVCVATLGAALGAGCLVPQEDAVLFTPQNRPPRILENTIQPARQSTVGNGPNCQVEFSAFVADPDIDDLLTWRWYIDYDPSPQSPNRSPKDEGVLAPSGEERRAQSAKYTLKPQDNPSAPVGVHVVTLMVFDGHLGTFEGPGSEPLPQPVPGTDGEIRYYSTTFDWVVTVLEEVCP